MDNELGRFMAKYPNSNRNAMENLTHTMEGEDKSFKATFKAIANTPHMTAAITE
jgi:hypothetical protein